MLRHAEFDEALGIDVRSRTDGVDPSKRRTQQWPDPAIAGKRVIRKSSRCDHDRNTTPRASRDPVRPELGLDQNRKRRTTTSNRHFYAPWMIQRSQARGTLRLISPEYASTRNRRGGSTNSVPVIFEDTNESACGKGFADTRRVDPDPLDAVRGNAPESLAKPTSKIRTCNQRRRQQGAEANCQ